MRTVSLRLIDLNRVTINLGFVGENEHTRVVIDCKKAFDEYPTAVPSLTVKSPDGSSYPAVTVREGELVNWDATNSDLAAEGMGEIQLAFIVDEVVAKSYIGKTKIARSLMPDSEAPDAITNWVEQANQTLGKMLDTVQQTADEAVGRATAQAESASQSAASASADAERAEQALAEAQTTLAAEVTAAENARDRAEAAQAVAEEAQRDARQNADSSAENALAAEAWAVGERNGEAIPATDEAYHNNSKYWAGLAQQGAEEHGFVFFDIDDSTGMMYVTTTDNFVSDATFEINENTGMLEVVYE